MNFSSQSAAAIKASLLEALEKYMGEGNQTIISDIYLQPNWDAGELLVLNDDDDVLSQTPVKELAEEANKGLYVGVEAELKKVLTGLLESGALDKLKLLKPYSFVLVDEDKETVAELLLVDDAETMFLSDELLKGLDEELDAFLKDLLEK